MNTKQEAQHGAARRSLAIFGASGGSGLALVRQALAAGHRVRILVRDRAKFEAAFPPATWAGRLEVLEGDVTRDADVLPVVSGVDAVLCALGAPARSDSRVRSEGTAAIVRAMKAAGVDRIVAVSVFGASETRVLLPAFFRYLLFPLYLSRVVADHERQERVLEASGLRWTVVRPPSLVDQPGLTEVVHGPGSPAGMTMRVSREELAAFMLDELERGRYVRAATALGQRKRARRAAEPQPRATARDRLHSS